MNNEYSGSSSSILSGKMVEVPGGSEEVDSEAAAHALMGKPFALKMRDGLPTVHTSASVEGEQWK